MAKFDVGVSFNDNLTPGMNALARFVVEAALRAVEAGAKIQQQRAKDLCPVSGGPRGHGTDGSHLVEHIDVKVEKVPDGALACMGVFDTHIVNYAPHVEFGPHARPFLRPAVDETHAEVVEAVRGEFYREINENIRISVTVGRI